MDLKNFYTNFASNVGNKRGKNMEEICRFCLIKDENNQSIFLLKNIEEDAYEDSWDYLKIFEYYSGLQVKENDGLPTGVCENCLFKFESAYKLRRQCQESDKKIRLFIHQEKSQTKVYNVELSSESPRQDHPRRITLKRLIKKPVQQIPKQKFRNFNVVIEPGTNCKKIIYYKVPKALKEATVEEPAAPSKPQQVEEPKKDSIHHDDNIETFDPLDHEPQSELQNDSDDEVEINEPSLEEDAPEKVQVEEENNENAVEPTPTKTNRKNQQETPKKAEKKYICQYCSRGFAVRSKLVIHERIHTGDRPFVCEICGLTFARPYTLHEHQKNHRDEADYQCDKCPKTFKRLKYLKEHENTHSGDKPNVCKICGAAYRHSGTLYAHMKRCKAKSDCLKEVSEGVEDFGVSIDENFIEVFTS